MAAALLAAGSLVACGPRGLEPVTLAADADVDAEVVALVEEKSATIRRAPADGAAHGELGLVYEASELWLEAERCFANAAELDPKDALWRFHRAIALHELGNVEEAARVFAEVAQELPREAAAQQRLGLSLMAAADLDGAEAAYEAAARLAPEKNQPTVGLAEVAVERGNHARAVELLEPVVKAAPHYKQAHYVLGLAYRGVGRLDDAQRALTIGAGAIPEYMADSLSARVNRYRVNHTVIVERAADMIDQQRFAFAVELLEPVYRRRPDDLYVMNLMASAHLGLGNLERSRPILERLVEVDPDPYPAYINLADLHYRSAQMTRSLEAAERAIALAPDVGAARFAKGRALLGMGSFEEAHAALLRALEADANYSQAYVALGEVTAMLNRPAEAIEHFEAAVALDPNQLRAIVSLGMLLMSAGRFEDARRHVERAEEIAPDLEQVRQLRARYDQRPR